MAIGFPVRKYLDEDGEIDIYPDVEDEIMNKKHVDFLDMKSNLLPPNYDWYRGVSGSWHHWYKHVLNGEITLHVQGADEAYRGSIRPSTDVSVFYSTKPKEGLHVPFKTPENCALHLDEKWKQIINDERRNCGN
jgi:hypothetical protein